MGNVMIVGDNGVRRAIVARDAMSIVLSKRVVVVVICKIVDIIAVVGEVMVGMQN